MTSQISRDEAAAVLSSEAFAPLAATLSDLAIATDFSGVVRKVAWHLDQPEGFNPQRLLGVNIVDTVKEDSRPKIRQMLEEAPRSLDRRMREINHEIDGVGEFPMRYHAVSAGDLIFFLGHEMRAVAALQSRLVEAQRALDEDYGRLRQMETRYRVLFQTSSEALLMVDPSQMRIQEANASSSRLLGVENADIVSQHLFSIFHPEEQARIRDEADRVASSGQPSTFEALSANGAKLMQGRLSIFRAADSTVILCSLSADTAPSEEEAGIHDMLFGIVEKIPDAMILTDQDGIIRWCNQAFLGMAEIVLSQQAHGEPLARFLGRPGVDIDIIIANAREHGQLRAFSSVLTGAFGSETRVEISIAAQSDIKSPVIGFVMRDITRYDQVPLRRPDRREEPDTNMMNLVGSVPLKELVRASTEEIEKMCIEAALKKTGNNRASAAEMLGLSRQSLYVKLRRFGLLGATGR